MDVWVGIAGMVVTMMIMGFAAVAFDAANRRWPQVMPPLIVLSVMAFFAVALVLWASGALRGPPWPDDDWCPGPPTTTAC